ncbi:MAG: hypothetical protein PUC23_01850 [bacterium]|nr:hypothetical protein [bacterium]
MYEKMIEKYINKLTKEDILKFSYTQNVKLTHEELDIIYFYIKEYWKQIVKSDPTSIFMELKEKLSTNVYNKMIELYNKYKGYKKYL